MAATLDALAHHLRDTHTIKNYASMAIGEWLDGSTDCPLCEEDR